MRIEVSQSQVFHAHQKLFADTNRTDALPYGHCKILEALTNTEDVDTLRGEVGVLGDRGRDTRAGEGTICRLRNNDKLPS